VRVYFTAVSLLVPSCFHIYRIFFRPLTFFLRTHFDNTLLLVFSCINLTMSLYVSTPISNEAVNSIFKVFTLAGDAARSSSSTITVTGRNGAPVHATALLKDGEYVASDEWEVFLNLADDDEAENKQRDLSFSAFQGNLEVRIGGLLLASFNDDDSQLSIAGAGGGSSSSSTSSEVGISFTPCGMLLRIIGDGPRKILAITTPQMTTAISPSKMPLSAHHHQVKFKVDNIEEKKEDCNN
jgi:hypothetical protein